jgi:DNA repair protein RecN (Recombination protein N)
MLNKLTIWNYAIIEELEINFSSKLNVITGETGAGKSIIIGALGLILGNRADSSSLVNKEKKCVVEGVFNAAGIKNVKQFLLDNDPDNYKEDAENELVIRREISPNGKSRAFVNDTPVNLSQLFELSSLLVDLHQQFDTLELSKSDFQREVLDALAGTASLVQGYQKIFRQWQLGKAELSELTGQKLQFDKESDYNKFQFDELEEADLNIDELENIEVELRLLNNAEGVKDVLNKANFELKESESPVIQRLKLVNQQLSHFHDIHPNLPALLERLRSAQIEVEDIAAELGSISDHIEHDPKKIGLLDQRLALGYKLLKKHGVRSTAELLTIKSELEKKLLAVLHIDDAIKQKEKEVNDLFIYAEKLAADISASRQKEIKPFETRVNKLLNQVGMPNARIRVEMKTEALTNYGLDSIEFLFNANIPTGQKSGGEFLPLKKVASGGELSRLMLCIKSLVAGTIDLSTMIFDEIDSGISGEAARQVAMIMKELALNRQLICITHQPQIAGKASAHYFVYKEIVSDRIKTNIRELNLEERITTIAKMLSGEKPTAAALENAREIVMN